MPSYQWSYPYNAADTATVFFEGSPADASYAWVPPLEHLPQPSQSLVRHADGSMVGYKVGEEQRTFVLQFASLPEGSAAAPTELYGWAGMQEFLVTHTDFSLRSFGLYDHEGSAEREVRFLDWSLSLSQAGLMSGSVRLIEVM